MLLAVTVLCRFHCFDLNLNLLAEIRSCFTEHYSLVPLSPSQRTRLKPLVSSGSELLAHPGALNAVVVSSLL